MRAALAALCAALLCIPASAAVGYRLGQDNPDALEGKLTAKTEAFFLAYNTADEKTVCEIVSGDFMGFYGPGACLEVYAQPTPPADRLTAEILDVVRVDSNTALAIVNVAVGKDKPEVSTILFELTKEPPAADYKPGSAGASAVWELAKGKKPKRSSASWQIVGVV